jgi:hypothetical protein
MDAGMIDARRGLVRVMDQWFIYIYIYIYIYIFIIRTILAPACLPA